VHAIWALSKTAGQRLASDLPVLVPIFFSFCTKPEFEEDDELREHCLQTLESFVDRCTREMTEYADTLVGLCVTLAKYDPNYADDDDDEYGDSMQDGVEDDDEDAYDDEDDFSDDDDSSWKVRRAAVKCIHAAVSSNLRPIDKLYSDFAHLLVSRFKEREESVKLDVFAAFNVLLHRAAAMSSADALPFLRDESPRIVRAAKRELGTRSVKTRVCAMLLLRELVLITPATVAPLLDIVMSEVQRSLADSSAPMKTEGLLFLQGVISGCGAVVLREHVDVLVPRILETAEDRYYKITAESLRLCSALVTAFGTSEPGLKHAIAHLTPTIYSAALNRLTAQDQDSEVKDAGIDCVGAVVSLYGSDLGRERLSEVASILCDRLNNEVTRLPAVRALYRIAESEHACALAPVMEKMTGIVGGFLRKSNRPLRLAALNLLAAAPHVSAENDSALLANVTALLSEDDLRLAALSLRMCSRLTRKRGAAICRLLVIPDGVFSKATTLLMSPMLQGRALEAIIDMFRALAEVNSPPLTASAMLSALREKVVNSPLESSTPRVAGAGGLSPVQCVAKCVAVICEVLPPAEWSDAASAFVREVSSAPPPMRAYALACLGELGRRSLLGGEGGAGKVLSQTAILSALDAKEEGVKAAAAIALGGVASGDGAAGIPNLVDLVRSRLENRYILLLSLRDAIAFSNPADVCSLTELLLQVLMEDIPVSDATMAGTTMGEGDAPDDATHSSSRESVQIATAECLGLLAQVNPSVVLPELQRQVGGDSVALRSSVVAAIKFVVSPGPVDLIASPMLLECLRKDIGAFFVLAADPDVAVRKNAVQTINAIARGQPALLAPHLGNALPALYAATTKDPALVRMVDLGPFKYEEDFGLDLRKSAFDTMRTLIGGVLSPLIPLPDFLERVVGGLNDHADVRAIAQLVLATVAGLASAPPTLIGFLPKIVKALDSTLNERLKENAVRQEQDRHEESLSGALRAVRMLDNLPDVQMQPVFTAFMDRTVHSDKLRDKYEKLQPSRRAAVGVSGENEIMRD
jgi:cullin-associated NEDD8-dissociated protein 1